MMDYDPRDFRILCRIIKELEAFSTSEWGKIKRKKEKEHLEAIDNHELLIGMYPPISKGRLNKIAHERTREPQMQITRPFYLPPLEGENSEFVPILNIECDMRRGNISYRLGMIKYIHTSKKKRARGFGFRFECEHITSKHGYPHVRITTHPLTIPIQKCPSWIPQHIPCLPMPATNVVTLLLCIIVSLYGKYKSGKMISNLKLSEKYKKPILNIIQ